MGIGRFMVRLTGRLVALGMMAVVALPVLILVAVIGIALLILLGIGVLVIKVAFFALLLTWMVRKVFSRGRRPEPALVGAPIIDVAAPRRDKYDIAAERELDEELGL